MRITIFNDDGAELAQANVTELKLDSRTRRVDIAAVIMPMWRTLPEGGHSAKSVMEALMEHVVTTGRAEVSYSRPHDIISVQSIGLS